MFECLVGYPPFYDSEPMATCRKIVNWRKTLQFPDDVKLSPEAKDLVTKLICDNTKRLSFAQIKAHPFFANFNWDDARTHKSPIIPVVTSDIDTQNFDKFEDVDNDEEEVVGDNGSFVGYTFKRVEQPKPLGADFFANAGN